MYTGSNPSALRSRKWLHDAMMELLEQEEYARINIKMICTRADLSRQTFYQIFESKEEILFYHFSLLFAEFRESLPVENGEARVLFDRFFSFFHARHFIRVLTHNHLTYMLEDQIEDYLREIELFRNAAQSTGHLDYMRAFLAGALTRTLLHWAENDYDLPASVLSHFVRQISKGDFYPAEQSALSATEKELDQEAACGTAITA